MSHIPVQFNLVYYTSECLSPKWTIEWQFCHVYVLTVILIPIWTQATSFYHKHCLNLVYFRNFHCYIAYVNRLTHRAHLFIDCSSVWPFVFFRWHMFHGTHFSKVKYGIHELRHWLGEDFLPFCFRFWV